MFCSKCGVNNGSSNLYCTACGQPLANTNYPLQAPTPPPIYYGVPGGNAPQQRKEKFGFSLTAMLIAIYAIISGVIDISSVVSGQYGYIYTSEVGLLVVLSLISLGFSIPAVVQKNRVATGALTLSLISLFIAFASAAFAG